MARKITTLGLDVLDEKYRMYIWLSINGKQLFDDEWGMVELFILHDNQKFLLCRYPMVSHASIINVTDIVVQICMLMLYEDVKQGKSETELTIAQLVEGTYDTGGLWAYLLEKSMRKK